MVYFLFGIDEGCMGDVHKILYMLKYCLHAEPRVSNLVLFILLVVTRHKISYIHWNADFI